MPAPTWTAGLFGAGAGADDLAEAERRVAILKAELEAIRAGRKEATASELRKLERDYRDAVAKVQQLRVTARPSVAPRPSITPRPTVTPPTVPGPRPAPRPVPTPIGTPVAPAGPGVPSRLGQLWQGRPRAQAGPGVRPPDALPGASALAFGQGQPVRPTMSPDVLGALTGGPQGMMGLMQQRMGLDRLRPSGGAIGAAAGEPTLEELYAMQRQMSDYEKAMMAWRMQGLAQERSAAGATAAYRQQQAEQAKAQLMQAWAIAQQELAHAQNVMASQIGTGVVQTQGQMWASGLPHALPQGTQVAPGFERGGPMQQLYRMSGSQFRPGTTGRISPQPAPSWQQMMSQVQQAMGQFGAGG